MTCMSVDQKIVLIETVGLLAHHGAALSDFEAAKVVELSERFVAFKGEAVVTDAEWAVIEEASAAMFAFARQKAAAA